MRLTVNECFSGIGSQHAGLERLEIEFEITSTSEVDKDVIVSYAAIHCGLTSDLINSYNYPTGKEMAQYLTDRNIGFDFKKMKPYDWFKIIGRKSKALEKYYLACILSKNVGDISKIEKLDYADFWTYSFPCQDVSVAGKGKGINKDTRSGLLYQVDRLLEIARDHKELPKCLMLENVKNLTGKKFKPQFEEWLQKLDKLGYNTYWQVLNSKNYGIPQNRERVFAISVRKDVDTGYNFPKAFDNGKRLKDILETKVDEKYYLSDEKVKEFNEQFKGTRDRLESTQKISYCLDANYSKGTKINGFLEKHRRQLVFENEIDQIGLLDIKGNEQVRRVYADTGISPTLNTMQRGNRQPKVLIRQKTAKDIIELPCIAASRGRNPENPSDRTTGAPTEQRMEFNKNGTSNTITTVQKDNYLVEHNFRIRKLTPLECWRLTGFTDEQFYKAAKFNSNSQLYKQAGNSIVVDVLYYIFKNLFINKVQNEKIEVGLRNQITIEDWLGAQK